MNGNNGFVEKVNCPRVSLEGEISEKFSFNGLKENELKTIIIKAGIHGVMKGEDQLYFDTNEFIGALKEVISVRLANIYGNEVSDKEVNSVMDYIIENNDGVQQLIDRPKTKDIPWEPKDKVESILKDIKVPCGRIEKSETDINKGKEEQEQH